MSRSNRSGHVPVSNGKIARIQIEEITSLIMINLRRREDNKRTSVFIEILYHKSQKEKMKNVQLQPQN